MLEEFVTRSEMTKYRISYGAGDTLCTEGDDSQDLFILVSGTVDIFKGKLQVTQINESGASVGEVAFLLDGRRTATVKAHSEVEAIRIPKDRIPMFLSEFPELYSQITSLLAKRLGDGTHAYFALKEFCNQLPDAVVATGEDGEIVAWNKAAEDLFGRSWAEMKGQSVDRIYESPHLYRQMLERLQSGHPVKEQVLTIRHPERGPRRISTSNSILYDVHNNVAGILNLSRDITDWCVAAPSRRLRRWAMAAVLLLCGLVAATVFGAYPRIVDQRPRLSDQQADLNRDMGQSFGLIRALVVDVYGDSAQQLNQLVPLVHHLQQRSRLPVNGLVVLNADKTVRWAYSLSSGRRITRMEGGSYSGIPFQNCDGSIHKVLSVYHSDDVNPTGRKALEIAFELNRGVERLGWLLFQIDPQALLDHYQIDGEVLKQFKF